jgi:hypothetical protein
MQRIIRQFKEETGKKEVDLREVAAWATTRGWPLPKPTSPLDRLAQEFSRAAREEIRRDANTGKPYRANHAYPTAQGVLWFDIDEKPSRNIMHKSLIQRREQMIGDGLQLSLDADHWNSTNLGEEPIQIPFDFTDDIEWRKNAPDEEDKAS